MDTGVLSSAQRQSRGTAGHSPIASLTLFATVCFRERPIPPIPIDDLTDILIDAIGVRVVWMGCAPSAGV